MDIHVQLCQKNCYQRWEAFQKLREYDIKLQYYVRKLNPSLWLGFTSLEDTSEFGHIYDIPREPTNRFSQAPLCHSN